MDIPYTLHTLPNGLRVLVHTDRHVPKVCINLAYRVGSKDESPDRTGFAHLFEHLMFEGSVNIPRYDAPLQEVGGENNAFTNSDLTNYYLSLPSAQIETGLWLESDRMLGLAFSEARLAAQQGVVIEEYKQRYLNQPYGDAHLRLRALHFTTHPYQWSTIGKDIAHIEAATVAEVEAFFYGHYAPNNATLVLAGDVDAEAGFALAEKWFGDIPRREIARRPIPAEPRQTAPRRAEVRAAVPATNVYKMYHIPANGTRAYWACDLLCDYLSYGDAALLQRELVRGGQIAARVGAFPWGMHDPGCLSIDAQLQPGVAVPAYEAALARCIEAVQDITAAEMARLLTKAVASYTMQHLTVLNRAMALAQCDLLGDPGLAGQFPELVRSITREELCQAAAAYLVPENCSTLVYAPADGAGDAG